MMKKLSPRAAATLIAIGVFLVSAVAAGAQGGVDADPPVTYTTINVQHSAPYWEEMHWSDEEEIDLRVTLWFPPGAACESGSIEVTVTDGEQSPNDAAKAIFDAIRAFWPNVEVHYTGRTVTVWGTSPDQAEGTEEEPAVSGGTDDQPYVSYYTVSL